MGTPSIETSPALGRSKPFTIFKAVVLPDPLRPRSTRVSPASTSKLRSCRIVFLTDASRNLTKGDQRTRAPLVHMTLRYS